MTARGGVDLPVAVDVPDLPQAVCAEVDAELFFPTPGGPTGAARAICRNCPELHPCLTYALNDPSVQGIWGGTTTRERQELRGRVRRAS